MTSINDCFSNNSNWNSGLSVQCFAEDGSRKVRCVDGRFQLNVGVCRNNWIFDNHFYLNPKDFVFPRRNPRDRRRGNL